MRQVSALGLTRGVKILENAKCKIQNLERCVYGKSQQVNGKMPGTMHWSYMGGKTGCQN
jgi:hypothetical protein